MQPLLALFALVCAEPDPAAARSARPSIWVDTSMLADDALTAEARRSMQGALQARLLEEGYSLGQPPDAIALRLWSTERGVRVLASTAHGHETHGTIVPTEPRDVLELELVHRALETLEHVEGAQRSELDTRPRVSLEVRGSSGYAPAGELYLRLLPIVAAADVVVVQPSAPADWRLCVTDSDGGHRSLRTSGDISCAEAWADPVLHREAPLEVLMLEVERQQALPPRRGMDSHRTRAGRPPPPGSDDPLPPGLLADEPHTSESRRLVWSAGFAAGMVARRSSLAPPGVDGLLRGEGIFTGGRGFGVGVALAILPGAQSGGRFADIVVGLGPRWRRRWQPTAIAIETTVGLDFGVLTHVPAHTMMQPPRSAWSVELPVALSVVPLPRLAFDLLLLPGAAAPSIEYRGVWDRGVMRLGLALGVRGFWGAP